MQWAIALPRKVCSVDGAVRGIGGVGVVGGGWWRWSEADDFALPRRLATLHRTRRRHPPRRPRERNLPRSGAPRTARRPAARDGAEPPAHGGLLDPLAWPQDATPAVGRRRRFAHTMWHPTRRCIYIYVCECVCVCRAREMIKPCHHPLLVSAHHPLRITLCESQHPSNHLLIAPPSNHPSNHPRLIAPVSSHRLITPPHLPTSPHISPHLPTSPRISSHLPISPHISPHLPTSAHISPHLPTSPQAR